jgi:hypothetical protein
MKQMSLGHVVALLVVCMCSSSCSPESVTYVPLVSDEIVPGITLVLTAEPLNVRAGGKIQFRILASNSTDEAIQVGIQCGPSTDVLITGPDGRRRSALADAVGPHAVFPCPLLPEHFVEAKSDREYILEWPAPGLRGTYSASAGLRRSGGLSNLSQPVNVTVR